MEIIMETERLLLREMTDADLPALCRMLQDEEVMCAYAHAFSDEEAHDWLSRQQARYRQYGFGLWAVILKKSGEMIGQCGVTVQDCNGREVLEVGYLFCKDFWGQGYATEAAQACRDYAFTHLHADEVFSIIRDNNFPSQRVAERNGMRPHGSFTASTCRILSIPYGVKSGKRNRENNNRRVRPEKERTRRLFF